MLVTHHPAEEWAALDNARYYAAARLSVRARALAGTAQRVAFALAHPWLLFSYLRLLHRVPAEIIEFGALPAGAVLYERWSRQSWRKVVSHAYLELPTTSEQYLRGRSRQALRTNLHRADAIPLSGGRIPLDKTTLRASLKHSPFEKLVASLDANGLLDTYVHSWSVTDQHAKQLGQAFVLVDDQAAVLMLLIGPRDFDVAHQTRYLLHTLVVADLIDQGVRHLVVESIIGAPPGHKYFAARLGYRACRLKVRRLCATPVPI
jgi:hypothetical protein